MNNLADLRQSYTRGKLSESQVNQDPIKQFNKWFKQAQLAKCPEPNAMTLATATLDGIPSARTVLLKGISEGNFVFYTNYESQKGFELIANPQASLLFYWHELERQVRIDGVASKTTSDMSNEYYESRPLGSKIGAWASPQSAVIPDRSFLEKEEKSFLKKWGEHPPRPAHWGGFILNPLRIEFWQGRPSRLHDRILFVNEKNSWNIVRLAP